MLQIADLQRYVPCSMYERSPSNRQPSLRPYAEKRLRAIPSCSPGLVRCMLCISIWFGIWYPLSWPRRASRRPERRVPSGQLLPRADRVGSQQLLVSEPAWLWLTRDLTDYKPGPHSHCQYSRLCIERDSCQIPDGILCTDEGDIALEVELTQKKPDELFHKMEAPSCSPLSRTRMTMPLLPSDTTPLILV